MCGIAGFALASPQIFPADLVRRVQTAQRHRGPDDAGWLYLAGDQVRRGRQPEDGLAQTVLLHQRLSILDVSTAGWQPMSSPCGRRHIVYNGEVYNYRELRDELSLLGHIFHSDSDTEVVVAAFGQWGLAAIDRFTGMFALALADQDARKLWLIRDPFGIKPLFYAPWQGGTAFASELPTLLSLPELDRGVDHAAVYEFLTRGLSDQEGATMLRAVRQVPPASLIDLDTGRAAPPRRYWTLKPTTIDISWNEAVERTRSMFLRSVELHMRSDVPLGAALSGGIDSSSIVNAMRRVAPNAEIHAISYVADEARLNEERWIDIAGAAAGAHIHKVHINPDDLIADAETLIRTQGEPFGGTSIYASYRVYAEARRQGLTVMLDGQGADEMMAGYVYYHGARLLSLLRDGELGEAARYTRQLQGRGHLRRAAGLAVAHGVKSTRLVAALRRLAGSQTEPPWLTRRWIAGCSGAQPSIHIAGREPLKQLLSQDLTSTGIPRLLRFADRNAMAASIENRVPFLTRDFAEFILSLPEGFMISPDGTTKSVFRAAMRGIVPDPILDRRDKIGFETPETHWLSHLRTRIRDLDGEMRDRGCAIFDAKRLAVDLDNLGKAGAMTGKQAWRVFNLLAWARSHDLTFA